MDANELNQITGAITSALEPVTDALGKALDAIGQAGVQKPKEEDKDKDKNKVSQGIQDYIKDKETGRWNGKDLNTKDEGKKV